MNFIMVDLYSKIKYYQKLFRVDFVQIWFEQENRDV